MVKEIGSKQFDRRKISLWNVWSLLNFIESLNLN